jgi:GxxExxY protein
MKENEITKMIIGFAYEVHTKLGPGLLESAYQTCLLHELKEHGIRVVNELALPIIYKNIKLDHGYRIDLLVEKKVVIEVKAVDANIDVHKAQLLTYLRLGNYKVGLILNFNTIHLRDGIKRIIN